MPTKFHIDVPVDPNLISREAAASILGCSLPTVQKFIDLQLLTRYRPLGRYILVDRREVESLAEERANA